MYTIIQYIVQIQTTNYTKTTGPKRTLYIP